jgi:chromosome segregation protein
MAQLQQIDAQLAQHVRETGRLREELRGLTAVEDQYIRERSAWLGLLKQRDDLIQAQCESLTSSSGGLIRAHVKRYADPSGFVNNLRQFLSGSRVQGNIIEALGESIAAAADSTTQWIGVLDDLEKLAEIDAENENVAPRPETPSLSGAGLTPGDIERIARSLKPEAWLVLSFIPIASLPVFEYRAREKEYIPFGNASAGQQATALLKALLNQAGPPLIIDQPEEDLDNPVMLEVVEQLWKAKQKRQIIFSSHNANLVVNGDAELVAWCDYRTSGDQSRGTIAGEGAIDVPNVREAIERIMEGGKAAFNLRREKYGF